MHRKKLQALRYRYSYLDKLCRCFTDLRLSCYARASFSEIDCATGNRSIESAQSMIATSSTQKTLRQVGHGDLPAIHRSGSLCFWRLANQRAMQSVHHMGLQKHCWHSVRLTRSSLLSTHIFCSLQSAVRCMQPMQDSNSCKSQDVNTTH